MAKNKLLPPACTYIPSLSAPTTNLVAKYSLRRRIREERQEGRKEGEGAGGRGKEWKSREEGEKDKERDEMTWRMRRRNERRGGREKIGVLFLTFEFLDLKFWFGSVVFAAAAAAMAMI